jgi:transmembrane sensor
METRGDSMNVDLLSDYLAGECTEEERNRIEEWIERSPEHAQLVDQLRHIWSASEDLVFQTGSDFSDVDRGWHELLAKMESRSLPVPVPTPPQVRHPAHRLRPVVTPFMYFVRIAAVVVLLIGAVAGLSSLATREVDALRPSPLEEIATAPGQRATVRLVDGTRVLLNVDSKLRFTTGFAADQREVYLEGEAFFTVSRDEARPFLVRTGDAIVQVLGTEFDVRAYPGEDEVRVLVTEGLVSVRPREAAVLDTVVLRAGHQGRVARGRLGVIRSHSDAAFDLAWMDGRLVFRDAPIQEVAAELSRWYRLNVELAVPPERVDRLNASFGDEPLGEILNSIAATLSLKYERDRRNVRFYSDAPPRP